MTNNEGLKITPAQCRAARAMLGWSQQKLAKVAGIAQPTIVSFETEKHVSTRRTLSELQRAMEAAGVVFLHDNGDGVGVRFSGKRSNEA